MSLVHCFKGRHPNLPNQSLYGIYVYYHANKVIMDHNGRSLLCSSSVCTLSHAHFAPSASPGNKEHSLSHWPRSVAGFFHSLPSLPLRSEGTRCLLWCCGYARAPGLGRIGTGLCAQWIPRTPKKKRKKKTKHRCLLSLWVSH